MPIPTMITIDGPAASGKTSLGKRIADELGYLFFDTGIMYRAVTWLALARQMDIENETSISRLAETTEIDVRPPSMQDRRNADVIVEDQDITWKIRLPEIDANVSAVSAYPGVRQALTQQQRRIGMRGRIVMVGRDIGTVVLPEADLKIYLDASAEERARRRYLEVRQHGQPTDYEEILKGVKRRDEIDSTRAVAPLRPAEDAVIVDSDSMDLDQVYNFVMDLIRSKDDSGN
jgi:cytidylate kinase